MRTGMVTAVASALLVALSGCGHLEPPAEATATLPSRTIPTELDPSGDPATSGDPAHPDAEVFCAGLEVPSWDSPKTRGSLAADRALRREVVARVLPALESEVLGEERAFGEVAILFAGDVGGHRVVVAAAPVRVPSGDSCEDQEAFELHAPAILQRFVLSGPAGAEVAALKLDDNGDGDVPTDEWAVTVPEPAGVTVVAFPRRAGAVVAVGSFSKGSTELVWTTAPATREGWTMLRLRDAYASPVLVRAPGQEDCPSSTLTVFTDRDEPGEFAARRAMEKLPCVRGLG